MVFAGGNRLLDKQQQSAAGGAPGGPSQPKKPEPPKPEVPLPG